MQFDTPLLKGQFIKRYKRFFVDVKLEKSGEIITAHCPNTGSMKGLLNEGCDAYVLHNDDPKRKLKYTLELLQHPTSGALVGVNTQRPNHIVKTAIESGTIAELSGYSELKMEQKYGVNSRIDILLTGSDKPDCYVEVKNTTLTENGVAQFPDAVTTRGQKHIDELTGMVKQGHRAVMFYLVNRSDCQYFEPADSIDPVYGQKLREFLQNGGEALAYACQNTVESIQVIDKLNIYT